jgi:hypothetical protein
MRNLAMPLGPRIACLVCFSGLLYTDDADRTDPHQRCAGHDVLIVGKTPETLQASFNSGWSMSTWTRFYRCLHARTGLTEQTDGCLFACGRPRPAVDTFKQPGSTALFSCLSLSRDTLHNQIGKSVAPRVRGSGGRRDPWC